MSSFRLVVKKSPKYTFRSLFYYTLSVFVCRFLINSSKVVVINHPAAHPVSTHTQSESSLSHVQHCRIRIWSFSFLWATNRESKREDLTLNAQSHWLMLNL